MKSLCVFCGSTLGAQSTYAEAATALGAQMAKQGIRLVYGGSCVGLMGKVADAVMAGGGEAIGVLPAHLNHKEIAHPNLTTLHITQTMHERKFLMHQLSDAFITLPGGLGTLEEMFEMLTWAQLGLHQKPCGLLNTLDYFSPLLAFLDHMTRQQFMTSQHRHMLKVANSPDALLQALAQPQAPLPNKREWVSQQQAIHTTNE